MERFEQHSRHTRRGWTHDEMDLGGRWAAPFDVTTAGAMPHEAVAAVGRERFGRSDSASVRIPQHRFHQVCSIPAVELGALAMPVAVFCVDAMPRQRAALPDADLPYARDLTDPHGGDCRVWRAGSGHQPRRRLIEQDPHEAGPEKGRGSLDPVIRVHRPCDRWLPR